jgi:hypothetical protein
MGAGTSISNGRLSSLSERPIPRDGRGAALHHWLRAPPVTTSGSRLQSSGSTFTSAWAWFEPTQNDTGVVELST